MPTEPPRCGQAVMRQRSPETRLAAPKVRPPSREALNTMSRTSPGKTLRQMMATVSPGPAAASTRQHTQVSSPTIHARAGVDHAGQIGAGIGAARAAVEPRDEHRAVGGDGEAVERVRDRAILVHAQVADETLAAVHRAGEAEIRSEERALGNGLGR